MTTKRFVAYSLFALLLASCLQPHVNRSRGVGTVFHSIADDKFYVVYKDTVINDTIRELVRPYRCAVFDSLCDVISTSSKFYMDTLDSIDTAHQHKDWYKAYVLGDQIRDAAYAEGQAYELILNHLDSCGRCKRMDNTYERACSDSYRNRRYANLRLWVR